MVQSSTDLKQAIADVCEASQNVRMAYLHGSHALGTEDRESDIDIAVLTDEKLSKEERFALQLDLMGKMADALHVPLERIDLIILQDCPPLLKYNVIRKGSCAFERDRSERVLFELHVEQEYDDESYYLDQEAELTLHRILSSSA